MTTKPYLPHQAEVDFDRWANLWLDARLARARRNRERMPTSDELAAEMVAELRRAADALKISDDAIDKAKEKGPQRGP